MKAIRRIGLPANKKLNFGQPLGFYGLWMSGCSPSPPNSQSQANTPSPTEGGNERKQPKYTGKRSYSLFTVLADIARNAAGDAAIVESSD